MLAALLLVAAPSLQAPRGRVPDHIELANGTRVTGRIVYADERRVVLQDGSRKTEYERARIRSMRSRAEDSRRALAEWTALEPETAEALVVLSKSARERDLLEEARLFAWRALALDPRSADAHGLLGHDRRGDGWTLQEGARRIDFADADAKHADFGSAWRFEGPHFTLRTNLRHAVAVDLALDLEQLYQAFFGAFGAELGLHEVLVPMRADVHADKASFPEQVGGRGAWFDATREVLVVDASRGVERGSVFHEAVHALLHAASTRQRNTPGALPAWVDEGLAECFGWSHVGAPGRASFPVRSPSKERFAVFAWAKEPHDLARVLGFSSGDFQSSKTPDLEYAQSYALVHYLLHGDGGALRPRFAEFLRGALEGRGSPTHFKKAIGGDFAALSRGWTAWAREHAR